MIMGYLQAGRGGGSVSAAVRISGNGITVDGPVLEGRMSLEQALMRARIQDLSGGVAMAAHAGTAKPNNGLREAPGDRRRGG